jgi:3-deoxy-D-manno-octulosonic-acid transferase
MARLALGAYTVAGRLAVPLVRRRRRHFRDTAMARERGGRIELPAAVTATPERYWLHGASVGELRAAPPLVAELARRRPAAVVVASALTDTGLDTARALEGVAAAFALPLDLPAPVARALDRVRPTALLVLETELWPRLVASCAERSIPVIVLNGKLSPAATRRYRRLAPLFRPLAGALTGVAAQSRADAQRYAELGVDPDRIAVTGSSKIDVTPPAPGSGATGEPVAGRPLVVAGSVRRGEEHWVLTAWRRVASSPALPPPLLVVAPRHLDQAGRMEHAARRLGLAVCRRSSLAPALEAALEAAAHGGHDVLVLDTLGELAGLYARATVAIVGGGFVEARGHNLLEPAMVGLPVLFGPRHVAVADEDRALEVAGGGWRVDSIDVLGERLGALLANPAACAEAGRRARRATGQLRGAAARALDRVDAWLGWASGTTSPGGP